MSSILTHGSLGSVLRASLPRRREHAWVEGFDRSLSCLAATLDTGRPKLLSLGPERDSAMSDAIKQFAGVNRWLSNFWPAKIELDGNEFNSAEEYYQHAKVAFVKGITDSERVSLENSILEAESVGEKKRIGSLLDIDHEAWDKEKVNIMRKAVFAKFAQNPELKRQLNLTGEIELIEGNTWNDTFWGVDLATGEGQNHLGKILMEVRDHFQKERQV